MIHRSSDNHNRTPQFKENDYLKAVINELKSMLHPIQLKKQKEFQNPLCPALMIIGSPLSGTTLLLQWLASLDIFAYPTNLLNRFAYAPYIGALIQKLLFEKAYDFHEEFYDLQSEPNFQSNLGKSAGALATNEFQHFFRNYMPNFIPKYLSKKELEQVNFSELKYSLASITHAFNKPFVSKAFMLQYNLPSFFSAIPDLIFLHIQRDPLYNMQSILMSRKKYYGDESKWLSVQPREYDELKRMDVEHQIAGQVYYTNKAIMQGLKDIPPHKKLNIQYEEFCKTPASVFQEIREKFECNNYALPEQYHGAKGFTVQNRKKLSSARLKRLQKAYRFFESAQ